MSEDETKQPEICCAYDLVELWLKDNEWRGKPQRLLDFLQDQLYEKDDMAVARSIDDILEILDFQTGGGVDYLEKWIKNYPEEAQDLEPIEAIHILEYQEEWDDPDLIPKWQRA